MDYEQFQLTVDYLELVKDIIKEDYDILSNELIDEFLSILLVFEKMGIMDISRHELVGAQLEDWIREGRLPKMSPKTL